MNNDDNFTKRAKDAMRNAASEAAKRHHNYVSTEHMLLGLLALGNGVAHNVLVRLGVNPEHSCSNSFNLAAAPPEYPVKFPFFPMTLWHGTMIEMGL